MKSKMMSLVAVGFMMISSVVFAQEIESPDSPPSPPTPPRISKGQMLEKMTKRLDLSAEQVKQIKGIDEKYKKEEEQMRKESETLRERRKALREKKKEEIDQVLTEEQKAKVKEMREKRGKKKGGKRGMSKGDDSKKCD